MRDVDALFLRLFKEGPASISMTEVWAAIANDEEKDRLRDLRLENMEQMIEIWARDQQKNDHQLKHRSQGEA